MASRIVKTSRLYNAKRLIDSTRGLTKAQLNFFRLNPVSEAWRKQVSPDVLQFVDKVEGRDERGALTNELLPAEKAALFRDPAKYFSRPHHVPPSLREQVYFPRFDVVLVRSPHLGPSYAQFRVPLWFSKLDLKSYLSNLYKVEVTHIRSFVVHQKTGRRPAPTRVTRGQRMQPTFKKRMTVQLVEPFVWPDAPTERELNSQDYDKKRHWESMKASIKAGELEFAEFPSKPNEKYRRSIAQQARELLAGKATWAPTWQAMPADRQVLQRPKPATALSPPPPSSDRSASAGALSR